MMKLFITVIATGFEGESLTGINNVESVVNRSWKDRAGMGSFQVPAESTNNSNDLDIPSFLRNKKGMK